MASSASIFFAGIGTTFIIIGAGFGGGLMFANSAVHEVPAQTRASSHLIEPVRVILPTTAEAAEAPQPRAAVSQPVPNPDAEKQVEKVDTRRAEIEQRERKKHSEERKARRIAAARAKRHMDAKQQLQQQHSPRPGIMALEGDAPQQVSLFAN